MSSNDLRGWLAEVERIGQLRRVEGAHWNREIGAISEANYRRSGYPALLFDRVPDYPPGARIVTGTSGSPQRLAIILRIPGQPDNMGLVNTLAGKPNRWEAESANFDPQVVETGAVNEHVLSGEALSLSGLVAPLWHEDDGGRYLATGAAVITRDPETGLHNIGAYRGMRVDDRSLTVLILSGKHGRIHYEKWFEREGRAPIAISLGHDPLLSVLGGLEVPFGISEFNYAGAVSGQPVEVIRSEYTGLMIPAHSEAVLEGWLYPDRKLQEGPFGEWTGYYTGSSTPAPLLEVGLLRHRTHPIVIGSPPNKPPHDFSYYKTVMKSAMIRDALLKAGIPDVRGVWAHEAGGGRQWVVVSIKQRYCGHSRQAGYLAAQCHAAAYMGRYVVVVDEDIDPSSLDQVVWAMCTRSDPASDIEIMHKCLGSQADPLLEKHDIPYNSRALIDACIPFERIRSFPKVATAPEAYLDEIRRKWKQVFD